MSALKPDADEMRAVKGDKTVGTGSISGTRPRCEKVAPLEDLADSDAGPAPCRRLGKRQWTANGTEGKKAASNQAAVRARVLARFGNAWIDTA